MKKKKENVFRVRTKLSNNKLVLSLLISSSNEQNEGKNKQTNLFRFVNIRNQQNSKV